MPWYHQQMRCFGYTRVSGVGQERDGTSLDGQCDRIKRYCRDRRLPAPEILIEVESGGPERIERRTVLRTLIAEVRKGDVVVVDKVDRWSRDLVYGVDSVRKLLERGVGWCTISEGIDAATPQGESTLGILSWVADQERKRIRERTVGRRKELRDQGRYVEGLPPVGYRRGADKILVPVAEDAAIVAEVYRRCVAGESVRLIREWLQNTHPARHGWDRKTIQRMLRTRVYLGEMTTSTGASIKSHEPIIDEATWAAAQEGLDSRRLGGRTHDAAARTANWLLLGLARCARCGATMGSAYGAAGYDYYACYSRLQRQGCRAPYVRVQACDDAVNKVTLSRLLELRRELGSKKRRKKTNAPATDFDAKRRRMEQKRERLLDMCADGVLSREELTQRLAKVNAQMSGVARDEAAEAALHAAARPAVRRELLAEVRGLERAWEAATPVERRQVLKLLSDGVAVAKAAVPVVEWRPVESLLASRH